MSSKHVRIAISSSTATSTAYTMHLVMCHLADHNGMLTGYTLNDLAQSARLSKRSAQYAVSNLVDSGMISRITRPGKTPQFIVLPNDLQEIAGGATSCTGAGSCRGAGSCTGRGAGSCTPQQVDSVGANSMQDNDNDPVPESDSEDEKSTLNVYTTVVRQSKTENTKNNLVRSKWDFDTWQRQYADLFWRRLEAAGVLSRHAQSLSPSKREQEIDKWADVVDKLNRLNGYSPEEIALVFKWLFRPGNWWIETGNLRTINKLRTKNKADEWYIDILFAQMEGSTVLDFDIEGYLTPDQMRKVCQAKGLTPDDFWERGRNNRTGEMDYTIKDGVL